MQFHSIATLSGVLVLTLAAAASAQRPSSSEALVQVSARVVSSCRVSDARASNPPQITCTRGVPVAPRVETRQTGQASIRVINF